jgi:dephospho-CoA kinase
MPIKAANRPSRRFAIALTGGIGSGKTQVSNRLGELGAHVIDADIVARELVQPGMPALAEIRQRFGARILDADGQLDRSWLREHIFRQPVARAQLESILHPRIRAEMQQRLDQTEAPYAVLVIPLLLESGQTDLADRILVVDIPEALQLARVQARDGQTPAQVQAILRAQASRAERLAVADDVIDNSGSLAELVRQTDALHQQYRLFAAGLKAKSKRA